MTPKAASSVKNAKTGIMFLVLVLVVWQVFSMFGRAANSPPTGHGEGGGSVALAEATPAAAPVAKPAAMPASPAPSLVPAAASQARGTPHAAGAPVPPQITPKQTGVPEAPLTDREIAMMKMMQEKQIEYLEKINELQMLKVDKDIALTNKDISVAKEAMVESDKKVIDLLSGGGTEGGLATQGGGSKQAATTNAVPATLGGASSLVSITEVQHRWSAVISSGGTLYSVGVGDILPSDESMVVGITKDSVTLQKEGVRKKLSLVPII